MAKNRIPIPDEIAAEIVFLCDRTCCVCNDKGKRIQIHHIDEDPSNNVIENLSVLCFDCHDQTQIKGGFGRKLNSHQVVRFKNDWIERVKKRREKVDQLASIEKVTGTTETIIIKTEHVYFNYKFSDNPTLLKTYLDNIIDVHKKQLEIADQKFSSGVNAVMIGASYDLIDFYKGVIIELTAFYSADHFKEKTPTEIIGEIVSNMFVWHRFVNEPNGMGSRGTIVSTMVTGAIMAELKKMIQQMAVSLIDEKIIEIDSKDWIKKWDT